ncbi:hypothetical protein QP028_08905 [Corynebacterium suedekumii]|nr:hypothetical protein QP028_08905 [Corynebacterium suedekumii]
MIAVTSPGRAVNETPSSTGCSAPGYVNDTSRSSTSPWNMAGSTGSAGSLIDASRLSTSSIRRAQMMARGSIIAMNVPIITATRICSRYCRNAVNEPTWTRPASTRWPPNTAPHRWTR